MKNPFIEENCTIEHEGQSFTSGGAVVTDNYVIGYMGNDLNSVTTWHGDLISDRAFVTSKWRINSYMSSHMYQVKALINGVWFTGRTLGEGMIVRLKPCK